MTLATATVNRMLHDAHSCQAAPASAARRRRSSPADLAGRAGDVGQGLGEAHRTALAAGRHRHGRRAGGQVRGALPLSVFSQERPTPTIRQVSGGGPPPHFKKWESLAVHLRHRLVRYRPRRSLWVGPRRAAGSARSCSDGSGIVVLADCWDGPINSPPGTEECPVRFLCQLCEGVDTLAGARPRAVCRCVCVDEMVGESGGRQHR